MPSLDKNRIRLELDLAQGVPIPINLLTGAAPVMPRARDIQWEIVLLNDGVLDTSVANVSSIVLEVKAYQQPNAAPLIAVNITGAGINAALTDAGRQAHSDQHAILITPAGVTGLDMTTPPGSDINGNLPLNLVITATRNGNITTLCSGYITINNDGGQYGGVNTPSAGNPVYYTAAQINGILASFLKIFNDPGVAMSQSSPDGHWTRKFGVDNNGDRYDQVQNIP